MHIKPQACTVGPTSLVRHKSPEYLRKVAEIDALFFSGQKVYALDYAHRYSLYKIVHQESVAAHSFFVALFVLKLRKVFVFDESKALKLAVIHDLPELGVSDVNHNIKKFNPELCDALKAVEMKYVKSNFPEYLNDFNELNAKPASKEALVVHLADALSVAQWAGNEIALGNSTTQIHDVVYEVNARIAELTESLHFFDLSEKLDIGS